MHETRKNCYPEPARIGSELPAGAVCACYMLPNDLRVECSLLSTGIPQNKRRTRTSLANAKRSTSIDNMVAKIDASVAEYNLS